MPDQELTRGELITPRELGSVKRRFEFVPVPGQTAIAIDQLRGAFVGLAGQLATSTPEGRYRALALTALEEALMWAVKSLSHDSGGER